MPSDPVSEVGYMLPELLRTVFVANPFKQVSVLWVLCSTFCEASFVRGYRNKEIANHLIAQRIATGHPVTKRWHHHNTRIHRRESFPLSAGYTEHQTEVLTVYLDCGAAEEIRRGKNRKASQVVAVFSFIIQWFSLQRAY